MIIKTSKKFEKQLKKFSRKQQDLVDKTILLFQQNPHDPKLDNHGLIGKRKEQRSIDVSFDLRIIFEEEDNYVKVLMLQIGSHSQLYK